jgi:hypothetical protein
VRKITQPRYPWLENYHRCGIDVHALGADPHIAMTSDLWPPDPIAAAALVALVVNDIHHLNDGDRDALLEDFLRVAWPSPRGQRQ